MQLFVRAHTTDGSSKSILVDESMTVGQVCDTLVAKNHAMPHVKWSLVEQIPELYMGVYTRTDTLILLVIQLKLEFKLWKCISSLELAIYHNQQISVFKCLTKNHIYMLYIDQNNIKYLVNKKRVLFYGSQETV